MKNSATTNTQVSKFWSGLLLVLGAAFFVFAQSAYWVNHQIFDKQSFTNTTQTALTSETSLNAIATVVVDKALADKPIVRRVAGERAASLVSSLLGTDLSAQAISRLSNALYTYMTTSDRKDIGIDLSAIKTPLSGVVAFAESRGTTVSFDPSIIPDKVVLVKNDDFPNLSGLLTTMLWVAPLLWLGMVLSFSLYIYLGRTQYAKKVYLAGGTIIAVSALSLLSGPFIPPPIASLVQNVELRVVVQNIIAEFVKPYTSQMYTAIGLTATVLAVFNQRYNLLKLTRNVGQKISISKK